MEKEILLRINHMETNNYLTDKLSKNNKRKRIIMRYHVTCLLPRV